MRHTTWDSVERIPTAADLLLLNQCLVKHTHCCRVSCRCVRGQHFRGRHGSDSSFKNPTHLRLFGLTFPLKSEK